MEAFQQHNSHISKAIPTHEQQAQRAPEVQFHHKNLPNYKSKKGLPKLTIVALKQIEAEMMKSKTEILFTEHA